MKGVSAIIAIILILMIVVALAALAYTWFTGIFASLTGGAQSSVESTTEAMGTNFRIEIAKNTTPTGPYCFIVSTTIRNVGTSSLNVSRINAYIDDVRGNITGISTVNLPYGSTANFNVSNATITCSDPKGKRLKLVAETGLEQAATVT